MKKINYKIMNCVLLMLCLLNLSCNDNKIEDPNGMGKAEEVRSPRVYESEGNVLVTWIDPYNKETEVVLVTDLATGEQKEAAAGVEKVSFTPPVGDGTAFRYEIKIKQTSGVVTPGVIIKLVKNWANIVHPVLDYHSSAQPQSGMFFRNSPTAQVNVFDIRNDDNISKLSSAVMQGVINQKQGRCYLLWENQHLTQLQDAAINYQVLPGANVSKNKGFAALFNTYRTEFKSLIVWDENEPWSWSLVQMIAAQDKGIPVTISMKEFIENELGTAGLTIRDIRGQWASKKEAYTWAINNLAANCHPTLCFSNGLRSDYKDNPWRIFDYAAAAKGFVFWLDETNNDDKAIMKQIFDKMNYPVGAAVMGYGMNENGDELNKLTNIYNIGFVVSDYYANGSYWCSLPQKSFQQRKGIASEVKPGKVYVAISLSDGDNVQFDANSLYQIFKEDKNRGKIPLGVTLAAGLQELNPNLLEFYYKNRTANEELTAGPSGVQFIYGDYYAQSGKYDEWLDLNKRWLSTAGFHTAHLWNTDDQAYFKQYMQHSGVDLVLDGSEQTLGIGAPYKFVDSVVRINQGAHCRQEGDVYRNLMAVSPSERRPVFHHLYLLTNFYGLDGTKVILYDRLLRELQRVENDNPGVYEFMLPMDLAASIRNYIQEGGIY